MEREKYSNFLFKECLVMKQSVKGEILRRSEKTKEEQTYRVKDSALSSDQIGDYICVPSKKA